MAQKDDVSLQKLLERKARLDARIEKKMASKRTRERALDTRRKAIAGGVLLKHCQFDPEFKALVYGLLDRLVERPQDRPLFDLPPLPQKAESAPPSNSTPMSGGNHDRT